MADVKLCTECKWYRPRRIMFVEYPRYAKCAFPAVLSKIDGAPSAFCLNERDSGFGCGPEGRHWEPL